MTVGETIRIKREERGMTQQELAERLFVSRQTVCRWESGSRCPDLIMSRKIATVLGISMDELIPSAEAPLSMGSDGASLNGRRIFAGFDCGGSHTRCMLVSEDGRILGRGKGGASNYLFCGKIAASEAIRDSIVSAFADADLPICEIEGMFIASAAVEVFAGGAHEEFFREVTGCKNVQCNSDVYPVWYAGSRFRAAVALIVGTGTVAYFLNGNSFIKASGWGSLFGDEGSGYSIGVAALRAASGMADRRLPMNDNFYRAILAHFAVDTEHPRQLLRVLRSEDTRKYVASATEVVMQLCENGDPTARLLVEDAADSLALSVRTVVDQAEEGVSLLFSGGLLQSDTPLRRALLERVSGDSRIKDIIITPERESLVSAAAIALQNNGLSDSAERLMRSAGGDA